MKILNEEQLKSIIRNTIKEWSNKKKEPITYSMNDKLELVDDPNIKDGGNFAIKRNGKTYWISRSNTVSLYVFGYDKNGRMNVLISKRGDNIARGCGKWNIVSGYLDYNETLEHAAARECFEETGVKIDEKKLINMGTNSRKESVNTCFCYLFNDIIENHPTSINNCENGEVSKANWVCVDDIDKYNLWYGKDNIIKFANRFKNKKYMHTNSEYKKILNDLKILLDNNVIDKIDYKKIINILNK
jgi:ADP-ribose pyrophosphatase YjhB (NUDIX family)